MSQKAVLSVPRLASTILLLARNPRHTPSAAFTTAADAGSAHSTAGNDIHVLMMKRHSKARFMPSVYVFPGGGVDVADYAAAQAYVSTHYHVPITSAADPVASTQTHMEAKIDPSPEVAETEAWACRVGALRELAEEAACVLRRDGTVCTSAQWKALAQQQQQQQQAAYDLAAAPYMRPVGRWVTPRHFKYRYDTFFYAALVHGASAAAPAPSSSTATSATVGGAAPPCTPAQELPLMAQASEVADLVWLSPLQALRRHESASDSFSLAPPTFLLLHALARQPSFAALAERWATSPPSPSHAADGTSNSCVGTLPYSSAMPCVEPRSRLSKDKKHIEDFMLPENYLYEKGWSEPAGVYRFCGEAFQDERHEIRMWVGEPWVGQAKENKTDLASVTAQSLTH